MRILVDLMSTYWRTATGRMARSTMSTAACRMGFNERLSAGPTGSFGKTPLGKPTSL